ncbi:MAG: type II toxin-antitoxin system prevent-host-death family antitoxin [Acidimicrobiaceae bacterium]|nr:type II toxin-antitoxin system prevent-host-death family antitoxin [Acidimicrobiaceae bacterium]MXZ99110.1 type II toxin-antitoxin system prevent-host-death family antitoxin [Acidimicrobiaceae bacterium]MYE75654.1 type II toxin-antitoxin system prevent-host-death family antitoxin [Acidimicrobiaceae bacterium]MYH44314.1 type II toxin-antitoxin system prevent-host-death family antitoxin [Acidimicrobiaceae bacterium]MYI52373.1 type II toxin-antitoxin system prevent-host-death family antitoxin [
MDEVGIRELKQNASAVVARVRMGATITVTDRGRPAALLSPIPGSKIEELTASGRLRSATLSFANLQPPEPHDKPLSATLEEMRAAERY